MQKTISIIIAIFNRKDELFELLNSLIAQTDKNFEVIIVDDGSSVDSVSYTHLDVYKRQIIEFLPFLSKKSFAFWM